MGEKGMFNDCNIDIFEEGNIDYINNKIDRNSLILYKDKRYLELEKEEKEIREKLVNSFNSSQRELFYEYLANSAEEITYIKCVAYYLGINECINIKKIK